MPSVIAFEVRARPEHVNGVEQIIDSVDRDEVEVAAVNKGTDDPGIHLVQHEGHVKLTPLRTVGSHCTCYSVGRPVGVDVQALDLVVSQRRAG